MLLLFVVVDTREKKTHLFFRFVSRQRRRRRKKKKTVFCFFYVPARQVSGEPFFVSLFVKKKMQRHYWFKIWQAQPALSIKKKPHAALRPPYPPTGMKKKLKVDAQKRCTKKKILPHGSTQKRKKKKARRQSHRSHSLSFVSHQDPARKGFGCASFFLFGIGQPGNASKRSVFFFFCFPSIHLLLHCFETTHLF